MLKDIKKHPTHFSLGGGLIAIGLWLIVNDHYFMWPPQFAQFANDDAFGAFFAVVGVGFIWWTFDSNRSARWNRYLLATATGLFTFLTAYELCIWMATGAYQSWISNAIITAFTLIAARRSSDNNG